MGRRVPSVKILLNAWRVAAWDLKFFKASGMGEPSFSKLYVKKSFMYLLTFAKTFLFFVLNDSYAPDLY